MQNDKILVQQTLAGDEQSFHHLIISYQADIYALIKSWVKDPDDAKELVQDVFLEAYRDLASLRQPESFHFWLRQIAKHRCQNWRERKRQFIPLSENIVAETPSIDETLILRETLAKVMQAIDELPEKEKDILKERYLDELSYAELQAKHSLSYKALSMRLLRAKQKVRARVEELLTGVGVFSWNDALRKMLSGGVEAVKIGSKVKIMAIGVAAILILSGIGVVVWHLYQSAQGTPASVVNQIDQNISSSGLQKHEPDSKLQTKQTDTKQVQNYRKQSGQTDGNLENLGQEGTKVAKSESASETKLSKTGNSPTGISPELEKKLVTFKEYADKKLANTQEYAPLTEQFGALVRRENELSDALENTSGEEFNAVLAEFGRVTKERTEVGRAMAPYEQRAEQIDKEYDEYFQTHYGVTIQQFKDAHTDDIKNWWIKNQFPKFWDD